MKHSLAVQIDITIIYLYKMQMICKSFIKLFPINIFVLNRSIHIYEM